MVHLFLCINKTTNLSPLIFHETNKISMMCSLLLLVNWTMKGLKGQTCHWILVGSSMQHNIYTCTNIHTHIYFTWINCLLRLRLYVCMCVYQGGVILHYDSMHPDFNVPTSLNLWTDQILLILLRRRGFYAFYFVVIQIIT